MDVRAILDEYRKGDEGKRIRLFLAFRDLRDYFSYIDDETPVHDLTIPFPRFPWKKIEGHVQVMWLHLREHFSHKPCGVH